MALQISRKGKVFVKAESSYGTAVVLGATDAVRHLSTKFDYDPTNRVSSPEKKQSPGVVSRFDRRITAGLGSLEALLRPSGTLNTIPEADDVIKAAFGAATNVTLSTTIAAGGAGTTTADRLTSVSGLAVGDGILFSHQNGKKYVRVILTIASTDITWAPALPSALDDGQAAKGCITYKLTTDLAISLAIAHYLPNFSRELRGVGIDQLDIDFDGTEEARFTASGPAQKQVAAAQSEPVAFTTVGGNPPTGMVGELYIADTAYLHKKLSVSIKNGLKLRNEEAGNDGLATEVFRAARREITLSLEAFAETEATLYDFAEAGTNKSVFRQNGRTEGNIVALYAPTVEWKVPDTSDGDNEADWSFSGLAMESADSQNDELKLILA